MRFVKYLVLALVALALVVIGFANRAPITLTLFPENLVPFTKFNAAITLEIYQVVFLSIALGLLLGFFWEWAREHKHRAAVVRERREKSKLATEVKKLKADKPEGKDEILALVDRKPAV
jgi:uncharacterized integral membrane protein